LKLIDPSDIANVSSNPNFNNLPELQVTSLPTQFLPYPKGSSIKYYPYTWGELQKFSSSNFSLIDQYKFILSGITTTGFDRDELAYSDFLFIAILRKLSSFSRSKFNITFTCSSCDKTVNQTPNLSEIYFSDIEDVPELPITIELENNDKLEISTLSISSYFKLLSDEDIVDKTTYAYAYSVINKPLEESISIIRDATGDLLQTLEYVDSLLDLSSQSITCKCSHCNFVNKITMRGIQELVQPFRDKPELIRNRIHFGKKSDSKST